MMTPTLRYRWENRLLCIAPAAIIVLLVISAFWHLSTTPLLILLSTLITLGFAWDIVYILLQKLRWDHDWPPLFALISWLAEGLMLWRVINIMPTSIPLELSWWQFAWSYLLIGFLAMIIHQIVLSLLFPDRRFPHNKWDSK